MAKEENIAEAVRPPSRAESPPRAATEVLQTLLTIEPPDHIDTRPEPAFRSAVMSALEAINKAIEDQAAELGVRGRPFVDLTGSRGERERSRSHGRD